jgi:hypothetical protein
VSGETIHICVNDLWKFMPGSVVACCPEMTATPAVRYEEGSHISEYECIRCGKITIGTGIWRCIYL